jgi:hypothetical protein
VLRNLPPFSVELKRNLVYYKISGYSRKVTYISVYSLEGILTGLLMAGT